MADPDPLVSAFFTIDFGGTVNGAFRECTGLGSENEVVEYKASGDKGKFVMKKVPGRMKWNNITLKRGITANMDMWKWRKQVEKGKVTKRATQRLDRDVRPERRGDRALGLRQRVAEQAHRARRRTRRTTKSASKSWRSRTRATSACSDLDPEERNAADRIRVHAAVRVRR